MTREKSVQHRASDPKVSVWVSANAGAGKTFVLVQRILRLLLSGADPSKILCLTYTRAAAAEMSDRIFVQLGEWASADDNDLRHSITEMGVYPIDENTIIVARSLFAKVLESPGGIGIRTIHSFCENLLRQFTFEADVPSHFQIIDDGGGVDYFSAAQADLIAKDCCDSKLCSRLDHLIAYVNENRFSELMRCLLQKKNTLHQWYQEQGDLDSILLDLRFRLGLEDEDSRETIQAEWFGAKSMPRERWLQLINILQISNVKTDKAQAACLDRAYKATSDSNQYAFYREFFLTKEGGLRKNLISKPFCKAHPDYAALVEGEKHRVENLCRRERAMDIFIMSASILCLGSALVDRYQTLKLRAGKLDHNDLINYTLDLLNRKDAASWVLYKLDGGIEHILIDEAQDMSMEQWSIVQCLSEEMFSGVGVSCVNRSIFAVGDEKQSIFSFQGAHPEEFRRMCVFFREKAKAVGKAWDEVELTSSFRSVPAILEMVDAVFTLGTTPQQEESVVKCEMQNNTSIPVEFHSVRHKSERKSDVGIVELWPEVSSSDKDDITDNMLTPDNLPDAPHIRLSVSIAEKISALIGGEESIIEGGTIRPIVAGDILILVRKRDKLFDAIIAELYRKDIPVAGPDRIVLTDHIAVKDLMSACDVALLPEDDLTLAALLKSPLIGLDEMQLFTLAYGRSGSLWQALKSRHKEHPSFIDAFERIQSWRNIASCSRPYEFFSHILSNDGCNLSLVSRLGPEASDVIDEFLDRSLIYEETNIACLQGFSHWMHTRKVEIKRDLDEGVGEVRVMTVHGAKGLESPVVIIAAVGDVPGGRQRAPLLLLDDLATGGHKGIISLPSGKSSLDPPSVQSAMQRDADLQQKEYDRLLYVAMTRARDRLYVCGTAPGSSPSNNSWYARLFVAFERLGVSMEHGVVRSYGDVPPHLLPLRAQECPLRHEPDTLHDEYDLPDWMHCKVSPTSVVSPFLSPSILGRSASDIDHPAVFDRGHFIHHLLQYLPELPMCDRLPAALRMGAYFLPDEEADTHHLFASEAISIIDDLRLSPLFSPGSLAEIEVIGAVGSPDGCRFLGRVDRLAIHGETVLLADYKTDRYPPGVPQDIPQEYFLQLDAYRRALSPSFPQHCLRAFLIWTVNGHIMELNSSSFIEVYNTLY